MAALREPPRVRHRSPAADSSAAVRHSPSAADTVYLAPAATALGAGRHGTWRRPTRHLAPAETALGAGRLAHPAAADTPTPPADSPRPTQTLSGIYWSAPKKSTESSLKRQMNLLPKQKIHDQNEYFSSSPIETVLGFIGEQIFMDSLKYIELMAAYFTIFCWGILRNTAIESIYLWLNVPPSAQCQ